MGGGKEVGVKEKLKEMFEKVVEDIVKHKVDSVAVWIKWVNGEPAEIQYELNAGVCECGEWACYCQSCLDYEYEKGKEHGWRECERYYGV